ncbi:MAG TPA: flagellar hook protein FlgE [Rhizobiaceae bacterium]|nr:flagellar hook protein FlgE [Rhizobiaceae bacterium]
MSLYGMMRTGVSGMSAQSNRLSSVADNIANSSTTGYKRSDTQFSSLLLPSTSGNYNSGGVTTTTIHDVTDDGQLQYTTSDTDLAIQGNGFFVVADPNGTPYLTRAGSFVPNPQGQLVNAAGYTLLGYSYANGTPSVTANGFQGLVPVTINQAKLTASPSTEGVFAANLPSNATAVAAANLPSANAATATYTAKSSLVTYDQLGNQVLLDVYSTKTADNTWEVAVYNQADASPGTSFPYSSGPLATQTLTFDPATGALASTSAKDISVPIPNGQTLDLDLSSMTQLATDYTVSQGKVNGNAPDGISKVTIGSDGTVTAEYEDGSSAALYRIPIADVPSPDNLSALSGNVYSANNKSGAVTMGFPNTNGMGAIQSGALEGSNVDIATELTDMIQAQSDYSANSKVFQTGSNLMDILLNLK